MVAITKLYRNLISNFIHACFWINVAGLCASRTRLYSVEYIFIFFQFFLFFWLTNNLICLQNECTLCGLTSKRLIYFAHVIAQSCKRARVQPSASQPAASQQTLLFFFLRSSASLLNIYVVYMMLLMVRINNEKMMKKKTLFFITFSLWPLEIFIIIFAHIYTSILFSFAFIVNIRWCIASFQILFAPQYLLNQKYLQIQHFCLITLYVEKLYYILIVICNAQTM